MKKIFKLFIGIITLIYGCDNPNSQNRVAEEANLSTKKAEIAKLNDLLKSIEDPAQKFSVPANKPSMVTGRKGTKIAINPDDLITESGSPLGKNISVELKELTNQTELLRANAQTVSDGKLLISGGAYFIGMTSNGENLKLKEGKTLNGQFPKISKKEMKLFYGERDELGQMNWKLENINLKPAKQPATKQIEEKATKKERKKSDMDELLNYIDSGYNPTPEEKKRNIEIRENINIAQKVYEEIGLSKMEWINCDIFLEEGKSTRLYVNFNPRDSVQYSNVYLVFQDINTLLQSHYFSEEPPMFDNLPLGYKVKLIAYTVKNSKVYAYSTDLTIAKDKNLTLDLKEISDKDFKKLLSK